MVKNPRPLRQCVKLDKDDAWDLIIELYNGELYNERSTTLKELKENHEDCDIAWAQSMMKVIDKMIGIGIKGVSRNYKRAYREHN